MMDEKTAIAAELTTESERLKALARSSQAKTYVVVVLGKFEDESLIIQANSAQGRVDQMGAHGIDLNADDWAAGHLDASGFPQVCGNSDEAKAIATDRLRKG